MISESSFRFVKNNDLWNFSLDQPDSRFFYSIEILLIALNVISRGCWANLNLLEMLKYLWKNIVDNRYNDDDQEYSDSNMSNLKNVYFVYFCSVGKIIFQFTFLAKWDRKSWILDCM